jgi:small conductance mechanosensitive channel
MDLGQTTDTVNNFASLAWLWAAEFLPNVGAAILILVVGYLVAGWAARGVRKLLGRAASRLDPTLIPVIVAVVRYTILVFVIVATLGQAGVQTTSLLAVLGAAGLAIGLALQGTLQNIAAGLMLLWLRPFRAGDYIEVETVAGTAQEIGLFHTQIRTWDGIYKFVPNSQLWNVALTNYTRNPTRLVIINFGIAYEDDMGQGRRILVETASKHEGVLADPPPAAVPLELGDSSVVLQLRAWAPVADFWNIRWDLTQDGKNNLEAAGITIPFPQRVVHMTGGPAGTPSEAAVAA